MALIFGLSMIGGVVYLVNSKKIGIFLAPAIMVALITCLMYIAGLLNIMPIMAYGILFSGFILGIKGIRKVNWGFKRENIIPFCFISLILVWLFWYLNGALYADGDTMTHWGRIVRSIYQDNRLPNFINNEIYCQSYPPATACWIYFVMKFTGYSEAIALCAQDIWIVLGAVSLFNLRDETVIYNKKFILMDVIILIGVLMYLNSFDTLIVDVLLASVTITAFSIIADKKLNRKSKVWMLAIIAAVLPIIKNSGILFSAFIVVLAVAFLGSEKKEKLTILINLGLPPLILFYLWKSHIEMVYYSAESTRHSIGFDYMKSIYLSRSKEDLNTIFQSFISKWFSLNISLEWQILALLTGLVIILIFFKYECNKCLKIYVLNIIGYSVYKIGMLAMYLFNMAGEDALHVAAYERYEWTYSLVMMFSVIFFALKIIEYYNKNTLPRLSSFMICLMMLFLIYMIPIETFLKPNYIDGGVHRRLEALIIHSDYNVEGKKVLVYSEDKYAFFYVKFTFDNEEADATSDCMIVDSILKSNLNGYEYLIIDSNNEQIQDILIQHDIDYASVIPLL